MNKRFFKFKNDLSIKIILEYLNISEKIFYQYNSKNININDFKINQFSSLSNSSEDSLVFLNKSIYYNLKNIKGVCITKIPFQGHNFKNNIIIPSKNPKFDFENLRVSIESLGHNISAAEISMIPKNSIKIEGKPAEHMLKMMEALEDCDDVQNVYSNFDIDDEVIEALT